MFDALRIAITRSKKTKIVIRNRIINGIITHPPSVNRSKRLTPLSVAVAAVEAVFNESIWSRFIILYMSFA